MERWETRTALVAVIVGSAAALPIHGRLIFAAISVVLIAVVGLSRLRASLGKRTSNGSDAASRAAKIRAERSRLRRR